jgi:hypothetical protein
MRHARETQCCGVRVRWGLCGLRGLPSAGFNHVAVTAMWSGANARDLSGLFVAPVQGPLTDDDRTRRASARHLSPVPDHLSPVLDHLSPLRSSICPGSRRYVHGRRGDKWFRRGDKWRQRSPVTVLKSPALGQVHVAVAATWLAFQSRRVPGHDPRPRPAAPHSGTLTYERRTATGVPAYEAGIRPPTGTRPPTVPSHLLRQVTYCARSPTRTRPGSAPHPAISGSSSTSGLSRSTWPRRHLSLNSASSAPSCRRVSTSQPRTPRSASAPAAPVRRASE